jgi:antitoxin VapB
VVHLPQSAALASDVKCVEVVVIGRSRIISPAGESWDSWFDSDGVSEDFMTERGQPSTYDRNEF